jgi:hypothetical protein
MLAQYSILVIVVARSLTFTTWRFGSKVRTLPRTRPAVDTDGRGGRSSRPGVSSTATAIPTKT